MKNHLKRRKKRKIKRNRRVTDSNKSKISNQYKEEAREATDAIIMDIMGHHGEAFSDYKKDVLDWSWDSIIK